MEAEALAAQAVLSRLQRQEEDIRWLWAEVQRLRDQQLHDPDHCPGEEDPCATPEVAQLRAENRDLRQRLSRLRLGLTVDKGRTGPTERAAAQVTKVGETGRRRNRGPAAGRGTRRGRGPASGQVTEGRAGGTLGNDPGVGTGQAAPAGCGLRPRRVLRAGPRAGLLGAVEAPLALLLAFFSPRTSDCHFSPSLRSSSARLVAPGPQETLSCPRPADSQRVYGLALLAGPESSILDSVYFIFLFCGHTL